MFPRLLSLFVLALTSLLSLAADDNSEVVWIHPGSNNSMCLGVTTQYITDNSEVSIQDSTLIWELDSDQSIQVVLYGATDDNVTFYLGIVSLDNPNNAQLTIQYDSQPGWKYDSDKMHFRFLSTNDTGPYCMSLANDNTNAQVAKCDVTVYAPTE